MRAPRIVSSDPAGFLRTNRYWSTAPSDGTGFLGPLRGVSLRHHARVARDERRDVAEPAVPLKAEHDSCGDAPEIEPAVFENNPLQFEILKPMEVANIPAKPNVRGWKEHQTSAEIPSEMRVGPFLTGEQILDVPSEPPNSYQRIGAHRTELWSHQYVGHHRSHAG